MKALIHGYFGMGNVGDDAILAVLIDVLRNEYGKVDIVVLSANPERTKRLHGVEAIRERLTSLGFWRRFFEANALVFAGGGRYGDSTLRRMSLLAILAKLLRKAVIFRGVGIYPYEWFGKPIVKNRPEPFRSLLTRILLTIAFKLADYISVRDEYSFKVLRLTGIYRNITIEKDLVFRLKISDEYSCKEICSKIKLPSTFSSRPIIGINLRTLSNEINSKIVNVVSKVLDDILKEDRSLSVFFVPFGYGSISGRFFDNDIIIGEALRRRMRFRDRVYVLKEEVSPTQLMHLFKLFKVFIGMRFHSIIFSIMTRVPTIAIVYDTKTLELLKREKSGCCRFSFTIDELSMDRLKEAVMDLMK